MATIIENKILKSDFLKLNEDDVLFITNPGRMGDEDGSTFVVKQGSGLVTYRIDGWMYHNRDIKEDEYISLDDASKQFPKWRDAWEHGNQENYKGKYKYLYMGYGNGLSIDTSIYEEFEPYLKKLVNEYLKNKNVEEKETLKYAAILNVWKKALEEMINDNKI